MAIEELNTCPGQNDLAELERLKSHSQTQLELCNHTKNKHCNSRNPISSVGSMYWVLCLKGGATIPKY